MIKDIIKFGKKTVCAGLATSFFGNISILKGDVILITKTGSMLDELTEDEIVEVPLDESSEVDAVASSELPVHRSIYKTTDSLSIIHSHSLYSTLMGNKDRYYISFEAGEILPFLKKIPIVEGKSGSEDLAYKVSNALKNYNLVIVKDHGVFTAGKSLKDCFIYISSLEHYSKYEILKCNLL